MQKLQELEGEVRSLRNFIGKDKIYDAWVCEEDAAAIVHLNARTFRRKVIAGKIPINFRHTNKRNYQYSRRDLVNWMKQTSTEI